MKYFENLTTENEIKARYKELAKKNHPDLGGCVEIMKAINTQYEIVITGAYQRAGKSITEIDELLKDDVILREKLNKIVNLKGLEIEICGSWIWITGETNKYKNEIKSCGFFWARLKKAWYWRKAEEKSRNRKKMSMDEIRNSHGSKSLKNNTKAIA